MQWETEGCLFATNSGTSRPNSASESLQEEFRLELERFHADTDSEHASWPESEMRGDQSPDCNQIAGTQLGSTCDGGSPQSHTTLVSSEHVEVFPGQNGHFNVGWSRNQQIDPCSPNEGSQYQDNQATTNTPKLLQQNQKQLAFIPSIRLGSCRSCCKHQLIFNLTPGLNSCFRCLETGSSSELQQALTSDLEALMTVKCDSSSPLVGLGESYTDLRSFGLNCLESFLLKKKKDLSRRFKDSQMTLLKYRKLPEETVLGLKVLNDLMDLTGTNDRLLDELHQSNFTGGQITARLQNAMSHALATISFSTMGESKTTRKRTSDNASSTRYSDKRLDPADLNRNGYLLGKRQIREPIFPTPDDEMKATAICPFTQYSILASMSESSYHF